MFSDVFADHGYRAFSGYAIFSVTTQSISRLMNDVKKELLVTGLTICTNIICLSIYLINGTSNAGFSAIQIWTMVDCVLVEGTIK